MKEVDKVNELSWKNVRYDVHITKPGFSSWVPFMREKTTKCILQNVSGKINTGEMVAIIGSSGAGKTTLMAAITQRIRGNILKGEFLLNGRPVTQEEMTNVAAFLAQQDSGIGVLTVEEHLHFMTELKLASTVSTAEKYYRLDAIMSQLGIKRLSQTRIKHLSGGERKKISLATELINEPMFLFCDEPTTGLDSYNTLSVMQTLQNLTKGGPRSESNNFLSQINMNIEEELSEKLNESPMISNGKKGVICSIHQPSSEVFLCFSHIILVDAGQILFQGTTTEAKIFFEKLDFPCPKNYNPAEYFVSIVSPVPLNNIHYLDRIGKIKSAQNVTLSSEESNEEDSKYNVLEMTRRCKLSWISQVCLLFRRSVLTNKRNYGETLMNCASNIAIAILIGVIYSGKPENPQTYIMDLEGLIFSAIAQIFFYTYKCVISTFSPQLPLIRRETGENLYNLSAFYVMKFLNILPKTFLECILVSLLCYYPTSFARDFETFLCMTMSYCLLGLVAVSYGFMWGCLFGEGLGGEISTPIDLFQMIFSGIYINVGSVPAYLKHFSLFFYINEALSYQYWIDVEKIDCPQEGLNLPCIDNGEKVLEKFSFQTGYDTVFVDYLYLIMWSIFFHIVGFLSLKRFIKKEGFY